MVQLTTVTVAQIIGWDWTINWKGCWRNGSFCNLRYSPGICL